MESIAIFRALQLGDFLCAIPAIRSLREAYPDAHIAWIGLPGTEHLQRRFNNYIDEFIPFSGYPGLPEQAVKPQRVLTFLQQMQERAFDLVLQMQGNGTYVNPLVALFGAKKVAGFYKASYFRPNEDYFIPYPEDLHEIERHLSLIGHLGIPIKSNELEFPIGKTDSDILNKFELTPDRFICIHPGARGITRRWHPKYFAQLGNQCFEKGIQVAITGTKEEKSIANELAAHMDRPPLILMGQTDLDDIALLLRHAKGLVSNCTGVAHIAYALRIPAVVISMDGEPHRWGPLHPRKQYIIDCQKKPNFEEVLQSFNDLINSP
ncbi:glycosyltransferase family 9 protein [Olivibacter sp. XZL3]|uniref:glycosyltransferase family 9 protein n=1 Tax=Olivibacter sp. XZL3 TaxID=1735116 RepID=UPI00106567BD|nr:glycosyltransferase family 9 protein [Olivibacter sp. XZL3]